ncbi:flagellar hook-length control protein FliK [Piscinibacter koreensis]|uniref:Flagellar hook-length control protein FliK n=1 Tax=Piscinibacter koreensis TaxID=2742824 RepID=A0A7Y6NML8_9BURK|nr:flagellar hook-length control protein FliK [Schlegelella koreensis]NUZ05934.1 flagellar hook-length control protein FliK [Schlegelella koreensis]
MLSAANPLLSMLPAAATTPPSSPGNPPAASNNPADNPFARLLRQTRRADEAPKPTRPAAGANAAGPGNATGAAARALPQDARAGATPSADVGDPALVDGAADAMLPADVAAALADLRAARDAAIAADAAVAELAGSAAALPGSPAADAELRAAADQADLEADAAAEPRTELPPELAALHAFLAPPPVPAEPRTVRADTGPRARGEVDAATGAAPGLPADANAAPTAQRGQGNDARQGGRERPDPSARLSADGAAPGVTAPAAGDGERVPSSGFEASFDRALAKATNAVATPAATFQPTFERLHEAPPVAIALPTPVESPDFAPALAVQVSVLASDGVTRAELHLNPAEMGPVSIEIAIDGTRAHVEFGADLAATRSAIEAGLPELAGALREAGFTLAGGGVSQHSRERQPDAQAAAANGRSGAKANGGSGDAVPAAAPVRRQARLGGVDTYA